MTVHKRTSIFNHKTIVARKQEDDFDRMLEEQRQRDRNKHNPVHLNNEKSNVIIKKDNKQEELAHFFHDACFSPVQSTFVKAIYNGHFVSWPGLTSKLVKHHLKPSIAATKGHINQKRQKFHSTKHSTLNYEDYICKIKNNIKKFKDKSTKQQSPH